MGVCARAIVLILICTSLICTASRATDRNLNAYTIQFDPVRFFLQRHGVLLVLWSRPPSSSLPCNLLL
jgi:hypothetical protein